MKNTNLIKTGERLLGKTAIVTGAGSGLGQASAIHFAAQGARVMCADISEAAAQATAQLIEENPDFEKASFIEADVSEEKSNEMMVTKTLDTFGRVDILFANAGVPGAGSVTTTTKNEWDRVIGVNLTGVFLSNKAVIPHMVSQGGGSIINQSSLTALTAWSGVAAYTAAKGGVVALTRQAAIEYAKDNVRINVICPGTIPTPLVTSVYEERGGNVLGGSTPLDQALAEAGEMFPLGRLGSPEDIAYMAIYLASDESKWVTGTIFPVDGGYNAI